MNGWQILGLALALWCAIAIPAALLFGRLIAHGEQQARTVRHTPAWARTDHHTSHRRHRR